MRYPCDDLEKKQKLIRKIRCVLLVFNIDAKDDVYVMPSVLKAGVYIKLDEDFVTHWRVTARIDMWDDADLKRFAQFDSRESVRKIARKIDTLLNGQWRDTPAQYDADAVSAFVKSNWFRLPC